MDIKFICKECSYEVETQTKFCPHCGKSLTMIETTYKAVVEVVFREKPKNCCSCRFGASGINGNCLLNPDIVFKNFHKDKYYGFYGDKNELCPIKI